MFCREQVGSLVPLAPRIQAAGGSLVFVGQGLLGMAQDFAEQFVPAGAPVRVLTDPSRAAYVAAGLRRSALATLSPRVLKRGAEAFAAGYRQGALAGDPWLHGGAFVIFPDGRVALEQRSEGPGDHVTPEELLRAVGA